MGMDVETAVQVLRDRMRAGDYDEAVDALLRFAESQLNVEVDLSTVTRIGVPVRNTQTCFACPSQWEGSTEDYSFYVRYRHGFLSVSIAKGGYAPGGTQVFGQSIDKDSDGVMSWDEVLKYTHPLFT